MMHTKPPSHGHGLRHDRYYGVSEGGLQRAELGPVPVLPLQRVPKYWDLRLRSIQYSSRQQAIVVDRHPRKSPPYYTIPPHKSPMVPNSRSTTGKGDTTHGGFVLRIGPSYKAHHPAQPTSITSLSSTGLGLGTLGSIFLLHIPLLLFSQDHHRRHGSGRIGVLGE